MFIKPNVEEQLEKLRIAGEERDARRMAEKTGVPYLDLSTAPVQPDALALIPEDRAKHYSVATITFKKPTITMVTTDPANAGIKELIDQFKKENIGTRLFVVSPRGLAYAYTFYKFAPKPAAPVTSRVNIESTRVTELTASLKGLGNIAKAVTEFDPKTHSVTEFVEVALAGAMTNRASDIHFEPEKDATKLRYRVDGILHDVSKTINHDFYRSIISRIKLLSNLKLNIQDRAQDGRFTIGFAAKEIEMRVAIAPSEYGEIIVMRILDPDSINITLPQLGLRPDDLEIIKLNLDRPNGMILNTGPTGSGKTTTLYAFLRSKLNPEIKIITIEDPIEYHIEGMEQTQVDNEAGYTFANGLRSLMRQDPDIILVGEIRDSETAEIGLQAALTGHLVFSTVHANEAAGAIPRLVDLGAKASSIGPALKLVIGQRLVRRLCEHCKVSQPISGELKGRVETFLKKLPERIDKSLYGKITIYGPAENGCDQCNGFGYKGRVAIYELLEVGEDLEALILKEAIITEFKEASLKKGMVTMQQDGFLKVITGLTSFTEVEEVTGKIEF